MRKIPENSTPIINTIIEALASARLSSYEFNIVMAVIRKTYGWDKKEDWISGSQLSDLTGILQNNCYRTIGKLVAKRVLLKNGINIGINKDVSEWVVSKQIVSKQIVSKQIQGSIQTDSQVVSKQIHTKETFTKETIQKKNIYANSDELAPVQSDKKSLLPDGITYEKVFNKYENLSDRKVIAREKWKPKIKTVFNAIEPDIINKAWYMMSIDEWLRGISSDSNGKDYFTIEYALRQQNIEKYYNDFISSQSK